MKTHLFTILVTFLSLNFSFSQKTLFTKNIYDYWDFDTQKWLSNHFSTDYQVFQNNNSKVTNSYFVGIYYFPNVLAERTFKYDDKNRLIEWTANYVNSRAFANFRTKYITKYQYTPFDSIAVEQSYMLEDSLKQEILLSEIKITYNLQNKPILEKVYGLENGNYKKSLELKTINEITREYDDKGQLKVYNSNYEKIIYKRNSVNLIEEEERINPSANFYSHIARTKYDNKGRIVLTQYILRNNDSNYEQINQQKTWEFNNDNTFLQTDYYYIDSLKTLLPTYYTFSQFDNKGKLIHEKFYSKKDTNNSKKDADTTYEYYENGLLKKEIKRYKTANIDYMDATTTIKYLYDSEKRSTETLRDDIGIAPLFPFKYRSRYRTEYGEIQANEIELGEFTLYPNPAKDNFRVSNILIQGCAYSISLYTLNGIKLKEYLPKYSSGYALCEWECEIPSSILNGQYFVVINNANGKIEGKRILIER